MIPPLDRSLYCGYRIINRVAAATRTRIVEHSAELFRRQGFAGTGVKQIVAEASAPFGSLYHFFPGGKEQLGEEVIRWSGAMYARLIDAFFPSGADPVAATRDFFAGAADTLRATDYADACPIATVALEVSSTSESMREACAEVFSNWVDIAAERLAASGLAPGQARELAISMLAALEGAFVLARALRSTEPLEVAGAAAAAAVREALGEQQRAPQRRPVAASTQRASREGRPEPRSRRSARRYSA
jgi:AcrR family transcriptional regulator